MSSIALSLLSSSRETRDQILDEKSTTDLAYSDILKTQADMLT